MNTDLVRAPLVLGMRGPGLTESDQAVFAQAVSDVRQAAASVAAPKALPTNGNLAIDDAPDALTHFVFTNPRVAVMSDVAQARGIGRGVLLAPPDGDKPGESVFRQTQFGDYPLRPGHTIAFSVEIEVEAVEAGQPYWPSGNDLRFILTTAGSAQVGLQLTQYETINPTYRRYHGTLKNTLGENVAGVLSQVSNNGTAEFAACNWQIARSSFPITDVDALDFDPFNTGAQDDRLDRHEAQVFALMTGGDPVRPSLGVASLGDSHTNGMMQVADTDDGQATVVGATPIASPLDRSWNGAGGVDPVYRADAAINSTTQPNQSNDQGFTAVSTGNQSWIAYLGSMLRAAFPSIGQITTANLAAGGSSAYTWAGEQAFGYVRAVAMPNDGDTVTLDGRVYTYRAAPAAAYAVQIGASPAECLANLMNAVNGEGGGFYAGGTAPHPTIWGASVGGPYARFCAIRTGAGGNALVIAGSAPGRIAATTADLTPVAQAAMTGGEDVSALYLNAKERLAGLAPDVFTITLGTNDANRPGYRGRGTQAELAKLIADLHRDYPAAKIIMHRPPVLATGPAAAAALVNVVIPAIEAVAQASSFVSVVDVYGLGVGTGRSKILNPTDGVHLTVYGYTLLAQLFARAIAKARGFLA